MKVDKCLNQVSHTVDEGKRTKRKKYIKGTEALKLGICLGGKMSKKKYDHTHTHKNPQKTNKKNPSGIQRPSNQLTVLMRS